MWVETKKPYSFDGLKTAAGQHVEPESMVVGTETKEGGAAAYFATKKLKEKNSGNRRGPQRNGDVGHAKREEKRLTG